MIFLYKKIDALLFPLYAPLITIQIKKMHLFEQIWSINNLINTWKNGED